MENGVLNQSGRAESLYIIIPAYNEEATIEKVLEDWYPVVSGHDGGGRSRLVVIDDGSRDRTAEIVRAFAAEHPLILIKTKTNGGHGAAIRYGYQYALDEGADWIFQTDSDGQTLAGEFEPFWQARQDADLVIGWRHRRMDGAARILVSRVLRLVVKLTFGVSLRDVNTPYRLMRSDALAGLMPYVPDGFSLTNVLLSALFMKAGKRVVTLPITFRARQGGVNSINMRRITAIGLHAVREFRRISREFDCRDS